ncbi:uncharacterized protein [Rutidosis leptorrhynchoides]|uniref:uncharacterized protein n=1 Tax=Rutidosis leptorrhynchoides TaxID=125765 RepID=UPI003A99AE1A
MANFNEFLSRANLIDQNIQNEMFTWDGPDGKKSRIDRVLVNLEWLNLWPDAVLIAGNKNTSDHNPLIWGKKSLFWGPKPFRFFNGWFEFPRFLEVCKQLWCSYDIHGYAAHVVLNKCKLLKKDLKKWSVENGVKNKLELASLECYIYDLKKTQEVRNLVPFEVSKLIDFKARYKSLQRQENRKKMLQSRVNWLRFGDKNTKFFHNMARIKNNASVIAGLQIGEVWCENPAQINHMYWACSVSSLRPKKLFN